MSDKSEKMHLLPRPLGCGCDCHEYPGVAHIVPCCDAPRVEDVRHQQAVDFIRLIEPLFDLRVDDIINDS